MSEEIQVNAVQNPLPTPIGMGRRPEKINGQRNQSSRIYLRDWKQLAEAIFGGLEWFDTPRPV